MNSFLKNYQNYISGKIFSVSGYILWLLALGCLIFSFVWNGGSSQNKLENFIAITILLSSITIKISIIGIILSLSEFLIRKTCRKDFTSQIVDKPQTKKERTYICLFWLGIIFTQCPFPFIFVPSPLYIWINRLYTLVTDNIISFLGL